MSTFTSEQIKERRLTRLAQIIHDHWEEGSGMDTRYFDHPYIHDEYIENGQSKNGGEYREHVVPRVFLRDRCMELYGKGMSIEHVTKILIANLRIVRISTQEAETLNKSLKITMPNGWILGESDPLERLNYVGIQIA